MNTLGLEYKSLVVGTLQEQFRKIPKAEFLQEGIFFPRPFICQRHFINEKFGYQRN